MFVVEDAATSLFVLTGVQDASKNTIIKAAKDVNVVSIDVNSKSYDFIGKLLVDFKEDDPSFIRYLKKWTELGILYILYIYINIYIYNIYYIYIYIYKYIYIMLYIHLIQ